MIPFFHALFDGYPKEGLRLEIRCLVPKWRGEGYKASSSYYALSNGGLQCATRHSTNVRDRVDVYFGVLPRIGNNRSNESVYGAGCLYADVDGGEEGVQGSIDLLKRCGLPKPNIAIVSGNGIHAYWLLNDTHRLETEKDRQSFSVTLRRLQKAIGGASPKAHADPVCKDPARILRVPDTFNWKDQHDPKPVKMVRCQTEERYSYSEWFKTLPKIELHSQTPRIASKPSNLLPQWVVDWIITPIGEGGRNKEVTRVACYLARDYHKPLEEVIQVLSCKICVPPLPEKEIETIAKWAVRGR